MKNKKTNKKTEKEKQREEGGRGNKSVSSGHLVEVTVSHQLVLVLQRVLEQRPYDGLQFGVGGEQGGAEQLQPGVRQAVH